MRLKPSKAQPPATKHKLLGVPSPERPAKVIATIRQALNTDCLTPETAQKLAGKLNFPQTTLFGQVGASAFALQPLYARGMLFRAMPQSA